MNRISVVIPAYNRANTIEYCLQSVLKQTLQPYEVIVVDDCSKDSTVEQVKKINNLLIKLIQLPKNSGAQAARNAGIKAANGEWIAFLDSDDEWDVNYLNNQLEFALENKYSVVYCGAYTFDGQEKVQYAMPNYSDNTYKNLLTKYGPMFPAIIVKKSNLEQIGYLDENVPAFQEWETCIRLAKNSDFGFLDKPLFIYHINGGDAISGSKERNIKGYEYVVLKHSKEIINVAGDKVFNSHLDLLRDRFLKLGDITRWSFYTRKLMLRTKKYNFWLVVKLSILKFFPRLYLNNIDKVISLNKKVKNVG